MPFVIDASITASWLLPSESHQTADEAYARLAVDRALAPSLWWLEIRNVLVMNERRGRIDREQTRKGLELLARLPIEIDDAIFEPGLLQLARRHRLTVYDAAYLELAQREAAALATLDVALAKAARRESVPVIGD
jgi:predicted nucleic acid-binding protein